MRHNKAINHLGRKSGHRKALLANMATSLILHKRIQTTVAKAKALKMYVEPLITKCKEDTTHSRRVVFSYLKNKEAVTELFRTVAPKVADRPGGYTRVLKTGFRLGDGADMALIELVDFNEAALASAPKKAAKKTSSSTRTSSTSGRGERLAASQKMPRTVTFRREAPEAFQSLLVVKADFASSPRKRFSNTALSSVTLTITASPWAAKTFLTEMRDVSPILENLRLP